MPVHRLADMTWEEVRDTDLERAVGILPVGAVEAHGPHLPLGTDVVIAEGMARECAGVLDAAGYTGLVLPPIWYTAADFAREFPGTVSVPGALVRGTVVHIAESLAAHGIRTMAIANAHLDPANLDALRRAAAEATSGSRIVFLDITRRAAASRLTEEFRTGACHAGRFEGSIVRAEAPQLYRADVAATLEANPASLSDAIRDGRTSFAEAGGPRAYFGWPADANATEGRESVRVLGALLAEEILRTDGEER